jgi:hypothetical protein
MWFRSIKFLYWSDKLEQFYHTSCSERRNDFVCRFIEILTWSKMPDNEDSKDLAQRKYGRVWLKMIYVWKRVVCFVAFDEALIYCLFFPFNIFLCLPQYPHPSKPSQVISRYIQLVLIICTNVRTTFNLTTFRRSKLTNSIFRPFS